MDQDSEAQLVPYSAGAKSIKFHRLLDGEEVAEVPLGHTIVRGTSRDDMIATVGHFPHSMIIITDRHVPEQQRLVNLPVRPCAVDISQAKDKIAVILDNGLIQTEAADISIHFDRHSAAAGFCRRDTAVVGAACHHGACGLPGSWVCAL